MDDRQLTQFVRELKHALTYEAEMAREIDENWEREKTFLDARKIVENLARDYVGA